MGRKLEKLTILACQGFIFEIFGMSLYILTFQGRYEIIRSTTN